MPDQIGGLLDDVFNPTKADLDAIYEYVRNQRPAAAGNPKALAEIQSFEAWHQGLGLTDAVLDGETLKEAKRRKAALNEALGEKIPDTWVPADAPQTPPPRDPTVDAVREGLDGAAGQAVSLVKVGVVIGAGILLLNLYSATRVRR